MEDRQIIDMYFQRLEDAIVETKNKYGRLLVSVAMGILKNMEDALECENDTYMKAWNPIPPQKPNILSAFLSKITRNISLDRYDAMHAEKEVVEKFYYYLMSWLKLWEMRVISKTVILHIVSIDFWKI